MGARSLKTLGNRLKPPVERPQEGAGGCVRDLPMVCPARLGGFPVKLTPTTIRRLALPEGQFDKTYFDSELPNFGVRVRAGGSRTYVVQYKIGGRHRRMPLGPVSTLDLGKARATARDLLAAVRLGRDVAGEKLEQRAKLAETFSAFLVRCGLLSK